MLRRSRLLPLACLLLATACSESNNSPPEATIELPSVGTEVLQGRSVTFRGSVDDPETLLNELQVRWTSSVDGELLSENADVDGNTEFTTTELSTGEHTITLLVVDEHEASDEDIVDLLVVAGGTPSISINSPTSEGVYYSSSPVTLQATVADAEDPPEELRVSWTQDSGEGLAADVVPDSSGLTTSSVELDAGTYVLLASVLDSSENTGTDTVTIVVGPPNTPPTCAITSPETGSSAPIGELVTFEGSVADVDVPADWLEASFASNVDGSLGAVTPTTAGELLFAVSSLSVTTHTITLTVADEVGGSCTDSILLTISNPPSATITTPVAGDPLDADDSLTLTGTVSDVEDPDDTLGVAWESDVDGLLGSPTPDSLGAVAQNFTLTAGTHLLTLTATDSAGLTGTDTVSVDVNAPPTAPVISITPVTPTSAADLTVSIDTAAADPDGGPSAISYGYAWTYDGNAAGPYVPPETAPSSATLRGQSWEVIVTATDGQASSTGVTASVTIGNSAPSITSVAIDPGIGTEITVFSCQPSGWSDIDNDTPGYTWQWTVNTLPSVTTQTIDGGYFNVDDILECTATPFDGIDPGTPQTSAQVTVGPPPWISYAQGDYAGACSGFDALLAVDAADADALLGKAWCTLKQLQGAAAVTAFQALLAVDSTVTDGWVGLSAAFSLTGDHLDAANAAQSALDLDASYSSVHDDLDAEDVRLALARALVLGGDFIGAERALNELSTSHGLNMHDLETWAVGTASWDSYQLAALAYLQSYQESM